MLLLAHCDPFDPGSEPFQSASDVVLLRNSLVHFKVEWTGDATASAKLEARLGRRFPPNSWAAPSQLFFPYRCVGAGAALWAYESIRDVLAAFFPRLGVPWRLDKHLGQLEAAFNLGSG
jgi:hypothetical protein